MVYFIHHAYDEKLMIGLLQTMQQLGWGWAGADTRSRLFLLVTGCSLLHPAQCSCYKLEIKREVDR